MDQLYHSSSSTTSLSSLSSSCSIDSAADHLSRFQLESTHQEEHFARCRRSRGRRGAVIDSDGELAAALHNLVKKTYGGAAVGGVWY